MMYQVKQITSEKFLKRRDIRNSVLKEQYKYGLKTIGSRSKSWMGNSNQYHLSNHILLSLKKTSHIWIS